MIEKDYHGWRFEDAINDVHVEIGRARLNDQHIYAEFITGNGVIKPAIKRVLDDYGLECAEKIGNPGTIVTVLE